ncbi:F-box/LRR-repeat protein, partial [Trifolium medium]|nr:F-box/LRR-repeat protein [Trifolium medium]
MEQEEDRLSNLPKIILHNILLRLPEEDATRTSVLSKAWLETWYTFPNLYFWDFQFIGKSTQPVEDIVDTKVIGMFPQPKKRNDFIDYVKSRLARFWKQGLAIKEFNLYVNCFELGYMSMDVDLWLKLASESGLEVLDLCNDIPDKDEGQGEFYVLPKSVIEAKSLTNQLVVDVEISVDYLDVCYMRELLQNIKHQNVLIMVSLLISKTTAVDATNPMLLDISSPPPRIKHMHLQRIHVPIDETLFLDISIVVDYFLLYGVPETISFSFDTSNRAFIE